jgi:Ca2+-binding RTX toxin-like protein
VQSFITFSLFDNQFGTGTVRGEVENLTLLGSSAINGTGSQFDNVLIGNSAANKLDGGAGTDTIVGLDGNDTYVVDNAGDVVDETGTSGIDTVQASFTFSLVASDTLKGAVENLTLLGTAAINGTGNALANVLIGNGAANVFTGAAGNDKLDGGVGADLLIGGLDNDTYVVDSSGDVVDETGGTGKDTVQSFISYKLVESAKLLGAVENLTLLGTAAINGTGNTLANVLTGNSGVNKLNGAGGNDVLRGGKGKDVLTGGDGNDRFDFTTVPGSTQADTIRDMNERGNDTIRVDNAVFLGLKAGKLAAAAFKVVTSPNAGVDASDRILFDQGDGKLYFDRDGSGTKYKPLLFAIVDPNIALTVSDFSVI